MIQGTGSDVGKSLLCAGLIRAFGCFKLFSLLSQRFFEFSFGFSCLLSDSLSKDTFFLVFQWFFAKLAVFGRFLGVFGAFLVF